jgi:tryptophan synthase beta chain
VIGCIGGGSNFAGIAFPFIRQKLVDKKATRIVAVEPSSCASITKGDLRYDFGDTAEMTPLLMMYTLGHKFMPPSIHAGGLRYHGMAPLVSHVKELGLIEARAYHQTACFAAGVHFARCEGILPAPEANHAIEAVREEAVRCREEGRPRAILFNLCGHGHFDMQAYMDYAAGKLKDEDFSEGELAMALAGLPTVSTGGTR